MKTNHQLHCLVLTAVFIILLAGTITYAADTIYVIYRTSANVPNDGEVMKYDSSGHGELFAWGLNSPAGLACDKSGNLYVSTERDGSITKIDYSGNKSPFGSGLNHPYGLAFDSKGSLYCANFYGNTISKLNSSGQINTFASSISYPVGLTFDDKDNLYVSADWLIKVDTSGNKSTFSIEGMNYPYGLAFDNKGNLYCANFYGGNIEKFDSSGHGSVFASGLSGPMGLAFGSDGSLYASVHGVGDGSGSILRYDMKGGFSTFASGLPDLGFIAVTPIPEPASALLIGAGLFFARLRRRPALKT